VYKVAEINRIFDSQATIDSAQIDLMKAQTEVLQNYVRCLPCGYGDRDATYERKKMPPKIFATSIYLKQKGKLLQTQLPGDADRLMSASPS